MNNEYYTKREVDKLLKPAQLLKVNKTIFGNRCYYSKQDVDNIISNMDYNNCVLSRRIIETFILEDVILSEWTHPSNAKKMLGISRQRLYQLKDSGKIGTVLFDGFILFNKEDIQKRCKQLT